MKKQPNIIYIVCHDLGRHLGCYGALVESPNLDRFAKRGVKFEQAFCSAPACSPSRACAMTGLYSHNNGAIGLAHIGWSLRQEQRTIVDDFNKTDYETIHVGLNHERHPLTNHYQIDGEKDWDDWRVENVVPAAIEVLRERVDTERPFYLNIGTQEVHGSRWSNPEGQKAYGAPIPPEDVYLPPHMGDTPELREWLGWFQSAIQYFDQWMGKLLDEIETLGYLENSIVVFTTDHGIAGLRSKGTLYDRGVETALLMHLPEPYRNKRTIPHLIQNIDFVPTLLEAAGVPAPPDLDGKSFWPLLTDQDYQPHEEIFTERNAHGDRPYNENSGVDEHGYIDLYDPMRAVRTKEYHYIRYFRPARRPAQQLPWEIDNLKRNKTVSAIEDVWPIPTKAREVEELYHITNDPQEFINLAQRPEYSEIKKSMVAKMDQWMRETNDLALTDEIPLPPDPVGWGGWPENAGK